MANRLPFDFVESVTRFTNRRLSAESRPMFPVIHSKDSGSWPGNSIPLESSGRSSFDFVRWFVCNGTVAQMIRRLSRSKWISFLNLNFVHYSSTAGNCIRAPLEGNNSLSLLVVSKGHHYSRRCVRFIKESAAWTPSFSQQNISFENEQNGPQHFPFSGHKCGPNFTFKFRKPIWEFPLIDH